jgi:IS4 transposase
MKGLPRHVFDHGVAQTQGNKHSKGFDCWDQLVAMVFAQLSDCSSLRALEAGFNGHSTHHYHLGTRPIRRSTLSDANAKRSTKPFELTVKWLMAQASRQLRRDSQAMLYLLDSTSLTLKGRGFDQWTQTTATRNTQGLKLHLLVAAHEAQPVWHSMTPANVNDIDEARTLEPEAGAIYVFDKGYCDYNWWDQLDKKGALFVTRFKRNAALRVEERRPIKEQDKDHVLRDDLVRFAHKHPSAKRKNHYQRPLRYVEIARPDHATPLVLATNDLSSPAREIAQRYKDRWQIELFFKWIKQHLRIKRFLGRTENAVKIQVLTALITYLLLALYKRRHGLTASLWHVLAELRVSLFNRPETEAQMDRERRRRMTEFHAKQPGLF